MFSISRKHGGLSAFCNNTSNDISYFFCRLRISQAPSPADRRLPFHRSFSGSEGGSGSTKVVNVTPRRRRSTAVEEKEHKTMPVDQMGNSSVLGSSLLVAGTAIGAGILALPSVTASAGYGATSVALVGMCGYNIITGLLLAEVLINSLDQQDLSQKACGGEGTCINLTSIVEQLLGQSAARLVTVPYLLYNYCLLVAYIAKAGQVVGDFAGLQSVASQICFCMTVGGICFFLSDRALETTNAILLIVLATSFLGLMSVSSGNLDLSLTMVANWPAVLGALPVLALTFSYQAVVPCVVTRLNYDAEGIRTAICMGMLGPLFGILAWEAVFLMGPFLSGGSASDPILALQTVSPAAAALVGVFSLSAVTTSAIGTILPTVDYIGGIGNATKTAEVDENVSNHEARDPSPLKLQGGVFRWLIQFQPKTQMYLLTLLPPLSLALLDPSIFVSAIGYAGAYGAMLLFALLPVCLAWAQRYNCKQDYGHSPLELVPGGQPVLIGIVGIALAIMLNETNNLLL